MKPLLPLYLWLLPFLAMAGAKEVSFYQPDTLQPGAGMQIKNSKTGGHTVGIKTEVLSSGFIDIINNGQVNASARFIRLYIGEPGKFAIPLVVYSGVSSNNFQNQLPGSLQRNNEMLVTNFINPLSGLANISVDGNLFLKRKTVQITRASLLYQAGIRVLTGYRSGPALDPLTGKPVNFLNSYASGGLYFQTGAWEKNNTGNIGVFWLAARYIACKSGRSYLRDIIPATRSNGLYHGWSLAWGVEINSLIDIKLIHYQYLKKPEISYTYPIYQFSFNYSLR